MASGSISPDRLTEYRQKGYTLVRRMFNSQEIDLLRRSAKQDKTLDDHAFGRDDGSGKIVRLSLWNHPGDTIYGMFARCESIVNSAILEVGLKRFADSTEDVAWLEAKKDQSARSLEHKAAKHS